LYAHFVKRFPDSSVSMIEITEKDIRNRWRKNRALTKEARLELYLKELKM